MYKTIILLLYLFFAFITGTLFADEIPRNGSTLEKAILLKNAYAYSSCTYQECVPKTYAQNLGQEIEYLEKQFGPILKAWVPGTNQILHSNDKSYDEVTITLLPGNEKKTVYFDISEPLTAYLEQLRNGNLPPAPKPVKKNVSTPIPVIADSPAKQGPIQEAYTPPSEANTPKGDTLGQAIIIQDKNDVVKEENVYLEKDFGVWPDDWTIQQDIVLRQDGKVYNEVSIRQLPADTVVKRYFDITARFEYLDKEFNNK